MFNEIANLHSKCFPHKPWGAGDFADLKKSGCDIIASQNGFIVYRAVADEAEIITIGVAPDAGAAGLRRQCWELWKTNCAAMALKRFF